MTYQISFKNHLKIIYPSIISIFSAGIIFLLIYSSFQSNIVLILWLIEFAICDLRSVIYHIDYWVKNRNAELIISEESITYKSPHETIIEPINAIKTIEIFKPVFDNESWVSFKYYFHYKLSFLDGRTMIVTSLLISKLELPCKDIEIKRRIWPFEY